MERNVVAQGATDASSIVRTTSAFFHPYATALTMRQCCAYHRISWIDVVVLSFVCIVVLLQINGFACVAIN